MAGSFRFPVLLPGYRADKQTIDHHTAKPSHHSSVTLVDIRTLFVFDRWLSLVFLKQIRFVACLTYWFVIN